MTGSTGSVATHFLPPERLPPGEIEAQLAAACGNPVLSALLRSVGGLVAVVNRQRQLLAVNQSWLDHLGIRDVAEVLGRRPGEALECIHHPDHPAGCGTGPECRHCGLAGMLAASLETGEPQRGDCQVRVDRAGRFDDLDLGVQAWPVEMQGERVVLVFLADIREARRRESLERVFFHDLNNTLQVVLALSELMAEGGARDARELAGRIREAAERMVAEIRVQRALGEGSAKSYPVQLRDVALPDLLADAEHLLRFHPAARGRILSFPPIPPPARLHTDPVLLQRVLGNLVINALEATASGGEVVVEAEAANGTVTLRVRNPGVMPPHVASRVFQRFFSTKDGPGRGHGTWSVKLFTEGSLNGTVDFESAEPRGTVFRLRLPAASPAASG